MGISLVVSHWQKVIEQNTPYLAKQAPNYKSLDKII